MLWQLDASFDEAEQEQAAMRRITDALIKQAGELAFREFPALRLMNADQIRTFGDRIWRHASDISLEIANLAAQAERNEGN